VPPSGQKVLTGFGVVFWLSSSSCSFLLHQFTHGLFFVLVVLCFWGVCCWHTRMHSLHTNQILLGSGCQTNAVCVNPTPRRVHVCMAPKSGLVPATISHVWVCCAHAQPDFHAPSAEGVGCVFAQRVWVVLVEKREGLCVEGWGLCPLIISAAVFSSSRCSCRVHMCYACLLHPSYLLLAVGRRTPNPWVEQLCGFVRLQCTHCFESAIPW
jgi:hypothetical protein